MINIFTNRALVIIATVIVIGGVAYMLNRSNNADVVDLAAQNTQSATTTQSKLVTAPVTVKNTSGSVVPLASQPVSMSYQNALELYKEGKRIQLTGDNTFCQATPNNVMYKNGTSIMIDNRSPQTHTVKVGVTYTIEGYGFKIIKLSSSVLPTTLVMDCDKQQNVAKILLQK